MQQRRKWVVILVAAVLAVVLGLASVALFRQFGPVPRPDGGEASKLPELGAVATPPGDLANNPDMARFYGQKINWKKCPEGTAECGSVEVPLDWSAPKGATIKIAVAMIPTTGGAPRLGSLLVNPGGPGASGITYLKMAGGGVTSDIAAQYDVVGFDPRGVGQSQPVDCVDDAGLDSVLSKDYDKKTDAGIEQMRVDNRAYAQQCAARSGPVLGFVDTISAARDMDVIRAALGDERMTYVGKSYGTKLGATYAHFYPHRVGRFVLDGAVDPKNGMTEVVLGQAKGMEQSFSNFIDWCIRHRSCPLGDNADEAKNKARTWLEGLRANPLKSKDSKRSLTNTLGVTGVISAMYSEQKWPVLSDAFTDGLKGDPEIMMELADQYTDRAPGGKYESNLLEIFDAVNCLDYPVVGGMAEIKEAHRKALEVSPTFGDFISYGEIRCLEWPHKAAKAPAAMDAPGAAPILVVGTTNDPATPYAWSQSLAKQLGTGTLLTYEGEGHTAYGRSSPCIDAVVDRYLLGKELPAPDATCRR